MTVILSEAEVEEAVKEWCAKRFPVTEDIGVGWKAELVDPRAGKYKLTFTITNVTMPPKEGPYR